MAELTVTAALARFQARQLQLLAHQSRRVLLPVALASFALLWLSPEGRPDQEAWLLWTLITALLVARWRYSAGFVGKGALPPSLTGPRRTMAGFNLAIGLCTGAFCWLDFPQADALRHAAVTTLLTGLAAGALASCAANRSAFAAYAVPMLGQLALSWLLYGRTDPPAMSYFFSAAIVALFAILFAASDDSEKWMRASFDSDQFNLDLVSQLRGANQALEEQKEVAVAANLAKTRFLAAASHDLRQPLHALSLYSASLSLQNLQGRAQQLADSIQSSICHSLSPLLDALLDLSKLDANLIVPNPQHSALADILNPFRHEIQATAEAKGLSLVWDIDPGLCIHTDTRLFRQCIRNVLDNAVKYTERGEVALSASERDGFVCVEIRDTGIGIRDADLPKVFEEFYQCGNPERDRSKGMGLGLAIVRRLVNLLGHSISLQSSAGGTQARILCTAGKAQAQRGDAVTAKQSESRPLCKKVLVIDNESSIRDSTRGLLEDWGCSVSLASSGQQALQLAASRSFDIVLSDFRLCASESGMDVLREFGLRQPKAARWLVTGDTNNLPWSEIQAEHIRVLHKPIEPGKFFEALRTA